MGVNNYAAEVAYTLSRAAREHYTRGGAPLKEDAAAVKHWGGAKKVMLAQISRAPQLGS